MRAGAVNSRGLARQAPELNVDLEEIEWHDLPLTALRIGEHSLELLVTPFDDAQGQYLEELLTLSDAEEVRLEISAVMTPLDFQDMEVATFDWSLETDGRLSGTIGILPANRGYWTISFTRALWTLQAPGGHHE